MSDVNRRTWHPVWYWLDRPGLEATEFTRLDDRVAIEGIVETTLDELLPATRLSSLLVDAGRLDGRAPRPAFGGDAPGQPFGGAGRRPHGQIL